jgi:tRNA(Ile)-lysidine synthase
MVVPEKFYNIVQPFINKKILAGFSGGADSTALLVLLSKCEMIKFQAVHFEHNIRKHESKADAEWCFRFCEKRGIPFQLVEIDVPGRKSRAEGLEAAARRLRLEYWQKTAGISSVVALGHHSDDRVENLLLRFARGANITGLTSLRPFQKIGDSVFIRPLAGFSKDEIINFLKEEGITEWREDYTNNDINYKRNFIRNRVLPEFYEGIKYSRQGFRHSIAALEKDANYLETQAARKFRAIKNLKKSAVSYWTGLHPALRLRVLRLWLSKQLGRETVPDRKLINRFNEELERNNQDGGEKCLVPVSENVFIRFQKGKFSLHVKQEAPQPPATQKLKVAHGASAVFGSNKIRVEISGLNDMDFNPLEPFSACFKASEMPEELFIRTWEKGDRMTPFSAEHPVKLKKIFTNSKIPSESRANYPLICLSDGRIIFVPGVRRSDFAPVTRKKEKAVFIFSEVNS